MASVTMMIDSMNDPLIEDEGKVISISEPQRSSSFSDSRVYVDKETERNFVFLVRNNEVIAVRRMLKNLQPAVVKELLKAKDPNEDYAQPLTIAASFGFLDLTKELLEKGADPTLRNRQDETALHEAIKKGDVYKKIVELLLPHSLEVLNAQEEEGETALMRAARVSSTLTGLILNQKPDLFLRDQTGATALMHASRAGFDDRIKKLFEALPDEQARKAYVLLEDNDGDRALQYAALGGDIDCLQAILKQDQDVLHQNKRSETALMYASLHGFEDCVAALIQIDSKQIQLTDQDGDNALLFAAREGHQAVVKMLLEKSKGDLKDVANADGCTPVMVAAQQGHADVVRLLVSAGAKLNFQESNTYKTALIFAAENKHRDVVSDLCKAHKNLKMDIGLETSDYEGGVSRTALEYALAAGSMEIVADLIEAGATINPRQMPATSGASGVTPLMLCARTGNSDLVKILLDAQSAGGLDVNACDVHKRTALMYAVKSGHEEVLRLLLKAGADTDKQDEAGNTALHFAAAYEETLCAAALLDSYANANIKNEQGWTPLTHAAYKGNAKIVRELLDERGIKVDMQDSNGMIPLYWAAWKGQTHLMLMFATKMDKQVVDEVQNVLETSGQWGMVHFFLQKLGTKVPFENLAALADSPVHAALLFSLEFGAAAQVDKLHPQIYEAMSKKAIDLAIEFLDNISDSKKKQSVLKAQVEYFSSTGTDKLLPQTPPEIAKKLSVEAGKFFAYPAVQDMLNAKWLGGVTGAEADKNLIVKIFQAPFSSPFSFFSDPNCFFGTPRGKFWTEFAFYLCFLGFFTLALQRRSFYPTETELFLAVLVAGFMVEEMAQIFEDGWEYFKSPWNWIDILVECIFVSFFSLRIIGYATANKALAVPAFRLLSYNAIFLWIRLLNICNLHPQLGPLLTIIKLALADIYLFAFILIVIMIGFSQTMFASNRQESFLGCLYLLFRSMMGDLDFTQIGELIPVWGPILAGLFLVISSILILNLLIARFSSTYEQISSVADYEFYLSKAQTYLSYAEDRQYMPPPFNLIPSIFRAPFLQPVAQAVAHLLFLACLAPFSVVFLILMHTSKLFTGNISCAKKGDADAEKLKEKKEKQKKAAKSATSVASDEDLDNFELFPEIMNNLGARTVLDLKSVDGLMDEKLATLEERLEAQLDLKFEQIQKAFVRSADNLQQSIQSGSFKSEAGAGAAPAQVLPQPFAPTLAPTPPRRPIMPADIHEQPLTPSRGSFSNKHAKDVERRIDALEKKLDESLESILAAVDKRNRRKRHIFG
mmetsp:Transcript_19499/g.32463  ORF Transcript_19499/g.32463 Transcript_19499/m.32463 type:complete len:1284 (-) Transcript_19499:297-4148(-)